METIFTIFLAGCSHDLSACSALERREVAATSLSQCEAVLDSHLEAGSDWPVTHGTCMPGSDANSPAWYPALLIAVASQPSLEQPRQTH